jgi:hypothetical protein
MPAQGIALGIGSNTNLRPERAKEYKNDGD